MAVVYERYGDALLSLAEDSKALAEYLEEVVVLKEALAAEPGLIGLFVNPKITVEEKQEVVGRCFDGRFSQDICGLVKLVVANGRAKDLVGILDWFIAAAKEKLGIGVVFVTSAVELSPEIKRALEAKMLATTHYKKLEMNYGIDKTLIGGLQIRLGDRIIDNTIKTKLSMLRAELRQ